MLPDLYTPPGRCSHEKLSDNVRVVTDSIEKRIMGEAKKFIQRKGIGKMKSYKGEMYRDSWGEVDESQIEMEEQVLAQEVQRFFNEDQSKTTPGSVRKCAIIHLEISFFILVQTMALNVILNRRC